MMKILKKTDIILIALLFSLSLLPLARFGQPEPVCYAEIRQEGTVIQRIQLTGHTGITELTVTYQTDGQEKEHHNQIRIENEKISVSAADCPDKICMQTGAISQPGEIIACLPHKLIIEIKSE